MPNGEQLKNMLSLNKKLALYWTFFIATQQRYGWKLCVYQTETFTHELEAGCMLAFLESLGKWLKFLYQKVLNATCPTGTALFEIGDYVFFFYFQSLLQLHSRIEKTEKIAHAHGKLCTLTYHLITD